MRKKRIIALILAIVMIIALPVGVYFYPSLFDNNGNGGNNNGGNDNGGGKPGPLTQLTTQAVAFVVSKVCDANYKILDGYAANTEVDNTASGDNVDEVENYATEDTIPQELQMYFSSLRMCLTVPTVLDYVMDSASSGYYLNSFTLDQTYMCRDVQGEVQVGSADDDKTEEIVDLYYYKAEAVGDKINLYLEVEGILYVCQVEYDFENDELISARTIAGYENEYLLANIDYSTNSFMISSLTCESYDLLQDIFDGEVEFEEIETASGELYIGNITNNINTINFTQTVLGTPTANNLMKAFIKKFELGIQIDKIFDKKNVVLNDAFIDAMDFSDRRLDFRIQRKNEFKYEYVSTWMSYNDAVKFMNALAGAEEFDSMEFADLLIEECRDILESKGEGAYTGTLDFAVVGTGNKVAYLNVSKVYNDLNAYNVSYSYGDEFVEFSCKYENNTFTSMDDAYFGVEWRYDIKSDASGQYISIYSVNTLKMAVDVPETIEVDVSGTKKNLPVKELNDFYCYSYRNSNSNRVILNIPASVEKISLGTYLEVAEINIIGNHPEYNSVDGVLFSKDMKVLEKYPSQKVNETYSMPDTVELIGEDAFCSLSNLKTLNVSSSLRPFNYHSDYATYNRYLGELYANDFWLAWSLQNVNVPSNNTHYSSIDGVVFNKDGDTLLMCPMGRVGEYSIPTGTTTIEHGAFSYCKYLTKINIPNTVTKINDSAFSNCEALKEIYIPANVTSIEFGAFDTLENITFAPNHPTYVVDGGIVYNKDKTTLYYCTQNVKGNIVVASTVTRIEEYAFAYHEGLESVVIPANVTYIGMRAFLYSSVKEVTIQGTVYLGWDAFFRSELEVLRIQGISGIDTNDNKLDWDIIGDCPIETIHFGGTVAEWRGWESTYSFEDWYYGDITRLEVICSDDSIVYTRTNN